MFILNEEIKLEPQSESGSIDQIVRVGVLLLRREIISSVSLSWVRAQAKKAAITLICIQTAIVLHEILHLSWFSTQHYFPLIGILIVLQFVNFYSYIWITSTQPGIIQKIVNLSLIKNEKYEMASELMAIPKN
jgi:hypothetical protein